MRARCFGDVAFVVLVVIAVVWLGYEFWRLLFQARPEGAVDLYLRYKEAEEWFKGVRIYETRFDAVYPPASYLLFWLLFGWQSMSMVRVLWVGPTLVSVVWLCWLVVRLSGASTRSARRLLWVVPLACYPIGAAIGNGQISILVVACLLSSLTLLLRPRSWSRDSAIAALMLFALIKPSVSAYFFWILLFVPGGVRAACLVTAGYVVLTLAACLAQDLGPVELLRGWLDRAVAGSRWGAMQGAGSISEGLEIKSINLHSVLGALGFARHITLSSLALLLMLGAWILRFRSRHLLSLMGVAAIVSRLAGYHGWYDDVLLLIPLVALLSVSQIAPLPGERSTARVLAILLVLSLLAPGGIYTLPPALANVYVILQTALWLVILVFLGAIGSREPAARAATSDA